MNNISDKKCAPGIVFTNGSCFSTEQLKKITLKYNNKYNKKLNININKKDLVYQLQKELSNICKDQKCWTKQNFLNNDNDESIKNIIENTFRPDGPKKNFDWLSTTHINDVFEQYQNKYNDFTFLGAVSIRATINTPNRLNRKPNQKPSEGLLFFSLAMYLPIAPVMNPKNIETNIYSIIKFI